MATHSSTLAWKIPWMVGCHLWGHTESDTTEATWQQHYLFSFVRKISGIKSNRKLGKHIKQQITQRK